MSAANKRPERSDRFLWACIGIAALVCAFGCDSVGLAKDLDPEDADRLVKRLRTAGVQAKSRQQATDRMTVSVAEVDVAEAVAHLDCTGITESTSCETPATSLLPTPRQDAVRARSERECQLSKDLTRLQGVRRARVRLAASEPSAMDASPPAARAAVWVEVGDGFDETSVRDFVHGAVPDLNKEAIELVIASTPGGNPKPEPAFARLGPLKLAPESLPLAKLALATVLATNALLAAALVLAWRAKKKRRP